MQKETIYEAIIPNKVTVEGVFEKLEEHSFELIILDVDTKNGNDWEILQAIKAKYQIPVIIMSDDKNLRNMKEFIELGCADYLTKPISPLMLNEIIYYMTKKCL